jgi:hypothetical protein
MAHVEIDRIEKRMACQCLRRLRIFVCSNIKRYTGRLNGFKSATVSESVSAGKLNRIYITTSQLGCLRRCLFLGVTQRAKFNRCRFPPR